MSTVLIQCSAMSCCGNCMPNLAWQFCVSSLFLFDRGTLVSSFESQRGARQGCVLGSLLFCLGLQAALVEATHDLPEVTIKAYVDDLSVAGQLTRLRLSSLVFNPLLPLLVFPSLTPSLLFFGLLPPLLPR